MAAGLKILCDSVNQLNFTSPHTKNTDHGNLNSQKF